MVFELLIFIFIYLFNYFLNMEEFKFYVNGKNLLYIDLLKWYIFFFDAVFCWTIFKNITIHLFLKALSLFAIKTGLSLSFSYLRGFHNWFFQCTLLDGHLLAIFFSSLMFLTNMSYKVSQTLMNYFKDVLSLFIPSNVVFCLIFSSLICFRHTTGSHFGCKQSVLFLSSSKNPRLAW